MLKYYKGAESWLATTEFIQLILNLWKILNVTTPFKGMCMYFSGWHLNIIAKFAYVFIKETIFAHLLLILMTGKFLIRGTVCVLSTDWQKSGRKGLTSETFMAWFKLWMDYLMLQNTFYLNEIFYVLLGKMQSDPLEGHFGMYWQLNEAAFCISAHQVLAEKKIRVLNFLHLNFLKHRIMNF